MLVLIGVVGVWWALGGMRAADDPVTLAQAEARAQVLSERFEAALINHRDPRPLLPDIEQLAADRPDLADAHRLLGQMHSVQGRKQEAYNAFARALTLSENNAELQVLAGAGAEELGHWQDAERHYAAARTLKPDDAEVWVRLANVAIKQGHIDEARGILTEAIERDHALYEAHGLMATVQTTDGDEEAALASLERAYNLLLPKGGKDLQKVALRLADLLRSRGEPVVAEKVLRLPEPEDYFTPEIMAAHADALDAAGLADVAGQYYQQWSVREPANPLPAAEAVHWYLRGGDLNQARAMLVVLRRIDARHPRIPQFERDLRESARPE